MARALTGFLAAILAAVLALALAGCDAPVGEPAGPLTLTLFYSARANDEALLEWTPDPRAERWQYRQREYPWPWGEWHDIPDSDFRTTSHRVGGLLPLQVYRFQVRPWTADGPGQPSARLAHLTEYRWRLGDDFFWTRAAADSIVTAGSGALLERGGTFRISDSSPYTFTVPESGLWYMGAVLYSPGNILRNAEPGNPGWIIFDMDTGRWLFDHPGGRPEIEPHELDERIFAAVRYEPVHPDPPLRALAGGGVGEVLLQCKSPPQGGAVQRWQYRQRRVPAWRSGGEWSDEWIDVPGSGGATRSYRLDGLQSDVTYEFQVRPWLGSGPGDTYASDRARLPAPGRNGIPTAGGVLESGRTFLANKVWGAIAFDVPDGMLLHVTGYLREHYDPDYAGDEIWGNLWYSTVLRDVASGSYLMLNESTGEYIERYLRPDPDGRDVGALFDQIIASTRRVPSGNFPEVVQP